MPSHTIPSSTSLSAKQPSIALESAFRSLRTPWWSTVAASVLLIAGSQQGAKAVPPITNGTQVWESGTGTGLDTEIITVSSGGHIRLEKGAVPVPTKKVGAEKIVLLNGAQISGVDETLPPLTSNRLTNLVEIGAASGTGVVALTLGQKGDTQSFTLSNVTLKQSVSVNAVSSVEATISSLTAKTVTVNGPGALKVSVTPGDLVDFVIDGGNLIASGANALGAPTNKLVLLGGELDTSGVQLEYSAIIGTDAAHATVTLADFSVLGASANTVEIKKAGATINVDPTAPATTATATIEGKITGAGSLEKAGSGVLILSNPKNDYSGNTILSAGYVQIDAANKLSSSPDSKVVFQGGALYVSGGTPDLSGVKFAPIAKGKYVKIATDNNLTFQNPTDPIINGEGGLQLVQAPAFNTKLTLNVDQNYTGATVLDASTTLNVDKLQRIQKSSNIIIGESATLEATSDSKFVPSQKITISKGGNLSVKVAQTQGDASNANITVQLEDLRATGPVTLGPGVVTDLKLKVRVAPEDRGATGLDTLLVGEKRVVVNRRLTVSDYATGVAPIPDSTDNVQLEFLNPVFGYTNNATTGFEVTRLDYSEFGAGTNGKALGHYFSQHLPVSGSSNFAGPHGVLSAMDNADYAPEIANILTQLSPGAYAELARLQVRRAMAVADSIEDRVDSLVVRGGGSAPLSMGVKNAPTPTGSTPNRIPEEDTKWAAWASGFTNNARLDTSSSSGLGRVREKSVGDTFGVERHAGSAVFGLLGSNSWGKSRFEDPSMDVSTDSWHIGLYTIAPLGDITWDASLVYGMTTNDARRQVNLPGLVSGEYRAKFDSRDLQVSTGFAYYLTEPSSAFQAAPVLRLAYVNTHQEAVNETPQNSANADYAAHVNAIKESSFLSKLGFKFSYATGSKDVAFSADASSYWLHDWTADATSGQAQLKGGSNYSFPVTSRKGSSDSALLNAGLQLTFSDRYTTRVSVNQELGGDRSETVGRATVGVKF